MFADGDRIAQQLALGARSLAEGDALRACLLFEQVLVVASDRVDAWVNYAIALAVSGHETQARRAYERARVIAPDDHAVLSNYATFLLKHGGQQAQLEAVLRAAVAAKADDAASWYKLGAFLQRDPRPDAQEQACCALRVCVELNPNDEWSWNRLGLIALRRHAFGAAQANFERAITCAPGMLEAHVNLGLALAHQGQCEDAVQLLQSIAHAFPQHPAPLTNIGLAHMLGGRVHQALPYLREAVKQDRHDARLSFNLACALLASGQWEEGWEWYETRLSMPALRPEARAMPLWRAESLDGKRLLLSSEQGFGDTLQFMRYASVLAQRGARIYLSVPPALMRLARTVEGVHEVVSSAQPSPVLDLYCPLPSVPHRLGVRVENVLASHARYLRPEQADIDTWCARLNARGGKKLRVGLVWYGSARGDSHDLDLILTDKRRSVRLAQLAPLAAVEGVEFVCLQKDARADDSQTATEVFGANWFDPMDEMKDFSDTAALIDNLDLIISVDTAVAHLAGALNRPVWLLSRLDGCWRWLLEREDSVWYASMRVFRQEKHGDWSAVIARVAAMLNSFALEHASRHAVTHTAHSRCG